MSHVERGIVCRRRSSLDWGHPPKGSRRSTLLRYGVAAVIVLGAAAVCAWAWIGVVFDDQRRFLITAPTIAGATILVSAWLLITAPWRWATKGWITAGIGVVVLAAFAAVRIEGTSGNVVPRLAWRWSPKHDFLLAADFPDLTGKPADLTTTTPDDYPQFLGLGRRAIVDGPALAHDWTTEAPRELWRRELGAGWGQFAIVNQYAVTQEQRGDNELVVCYELLTGKPVWVHADKTRFDEVVSGVGPRSTPTISDGRVYTVGATGRMNCLDGATGKMIWTHDILEENDALLPDGNMRLNWGLSISPLVVGNLVVVNAGGSEGRALVAYDKESGEVVWSVGNDKTCYSSPHLCTLDGKEQIVVLYQECVVGHDVADGHELWRFDWPGLDSRCSQPMVAGEDVLVSAGYGHGSAMIGLITNEDSEPKLGNRWSERNTRNLKSKFANMILLDGFVYAPRRRRLDLRRCHFRSPLLERGAIWPRTVAAGGGHVDRAGRKRKPDPGRAQPSEANRGRPHRRLARRRLVCRRDLEQSGHLRQIPAGPQREASDLLRTTTSKIIAPRSSAANLSAARVFFGSARHF